MATPGEMIQVAARALLLPEVTVGSYYRAIREEGLVKTGGRGRSAAQVSALDVARLLIAILASELVRDAPEAVGVFGDLRQAGSEVELVKPIAGDRLGLPGEHRFEEGLVAVLELLSSRRRAQTAGGEDLVYRFGVDVELSDLQAHLHTDEAFLTYTHHQGTPRRPNESDYGLRVRRSLGGPALQMLASLVADRDYEGHKDQA